VTKTIVSFDGEIHILKTGDSIQIQRHHTPIEIEVVSDDAAEIIRETHKPYECDEPPHEHSERIANPVDPEILKMYLENE